MLLDGAETRSLNCETLQEMEDTVLKAANEQLCKGDYHMCQPYSCGQVFGWQAIALPEVVWNTKVLLNKAPLEIPVVGLSDCNTKVVQIARSYDWRSSSYPHEMLHIMQDCKGTGEESERDSKSGVGHEGWEEQGLFDFVESFTEGEL